MTQGFWQSRLAFWGTMAAALVLAVLIWFRDQSYPIYLSAISTVAALAVGYIAARLLSSVVANQVQTKLLGILHVDMDPKLFVERYRDVPERLRHDSASYIIARAYLADGYAADGDFRKAMETLCPPDDPAYAKDIALRGLYYNNYSRYCLGDGDMEGAAKAIGSLSQVVEAARASKPALSRNLAESLRLHRNQAACITGEPVEAEWLKEQCDHAQYLLRRMDAAQALAQDAMNRGDTPTAREYLHILQREGGRTYFSRWASRQENRLGAAAGR